MLQKTIADLCSGSVQVSTALKRCKVLLTYIENERLESFIKDELEGYEWDKCPNYRVLVGQPKGLYRRRYDGQTMVLPLDFSKINEQTGLNFDERNVTSSIVEIENLLNQAGGGTGEICISFSSDQLNLLWENSNAQNDNGWALERAWWAFPTNLFHSILSRTQDTLIELLITINKESPELNQKLEFMNDNKNHEAKAFHTNINGNVIGSNLGIGETVTQKENVANYNQDIQDVIDKIMQLGFEKDDTKDLEEILVEKKKTGNPVSKQILAWVGKMSAKAVEKGIEHKIPQLTEALGDFF